MRLTCPNCSALYDVPAANLPSGGIAVQCSACLFNWFHTPISAPIDDYTKMETDPFKVANQSKAQNEIKDEKIESIQRESKVDKTVSSVPTNDIFYKSEDRKELADAKLPTRRLHPTVAEVLKEEAKREALARAGRIGQIDSTPSTVAALIDKHRKDQITENYANEEAMDSDFQDTRAVLQLEKSKDSDKVLKKHNLKNEKDLTSENEKKVNQIIETANFEGKKRKGYRVKKTGFYAGLLVFLLALAL